MGLGLRRQLPGLGLHLAGGFDHRFRRFQEDRVQLTSPKEARLNLVLLERSTDGLKGDLAIRGGEVVYSQALEVHTLEAAIDPVEQLGIVEKQTKAESLEL